jgi:hypothetical protein
MYATLREIEPPTAKQRFLNSKYLVLCATTTYPANTHKAKKTIAKGALCLRLCTPLNFMVPYQIPAVGTSLGTVNLVAPIDRNFIDISAIIRFRLCTFELPIE